MTEPVEGAGPCPRPDPQRWEPSMTLVDLRLTETAATIRVDGALTASDTPVFHRAVQWALDAEVTDVRLDLADVGRMDPAALIVLVALAQRLRGSGRVLSFVAVSDDCRDALTSYPLFIEPLDGAAAPAAWQSWRRLGQRPGSTGAAHDLEHEREALT